MRKTMDWGGTAWNAIPNHDGYYASEDGRILSTRRAQPYIMDPLHSSDGHLYVYMYGGGKPKKVWVHRAVLSAHCGREEEGLVCRHLDDDPGNNNISNLAWGTRQENADDRKRNKGYPTGEKSSGAKLKRDQVMEIRYRYSRGESSADLSAEYGVSRNAILKLVRGSTWSDLPLIPVEVKHISRRKTPLSTEHVIKFVEGGRRYAASRKKLRELVKCACGCGTLIETPDSKGRTKRFAHGHNARGTHWRWSKNGKNDKDSVV